MCHRCEQPLRVVRPAHRLGDCAGRSPGLRVVTYRPAFPVSQWLMRTKARRSQLRGQPRPRHDCRSVFPLASPVRAGEPARYEHFAIKPERQDLVTQSAVCARAISRAVASELQNNAHGLGIVDRLAGLAAPQAGCRDPSQLRTYCQLRDTQLTVQTRRGHGPRGKGAREFCGRPCLGSPRIQEQHLCMRSVLLFFTA
jgi:hypothetical protein